MESGLTPRVRQELAEALAAERQRILRSQRSLERAERELSESQGQEADASGSAADVASDLAEEELVLTLELAERERLREVEAALERLDKGTYGKCQRCGQPISVERLYALPWARYCRACS